jgi:NMD protein affecting ribosome stability and mRNA decay
MTDWPLICDRCGAERYVGILYNGMCPDCHSDATTEALAVPDIDTTGQSALGDFV